VRGRQITGLPNQIKNMPFQVRGRATMAALILCWATLYLGPDARPVRFSSQALRSQQRIDNEPEVEPRPPCGEDAIPTYPHLGDQPVVKSWSQSDVGRDWKPPACTGWTEPGFTTLVTTAARFRHDSGAEGLLLRIGGISQLVGIRYWSATHKRWRPLVVDAYALTALQGERRANFALDEMKEGAVFYFEQEDNLSGKATYRMRVVEASADRLVIEVENVASLRYFHIPILRPGEMQSIYFLDRESDAVWRYYSIVRVGKDANRLIARNDSSAINRAVAFYRHLVGIPTDQEPPAAR
jgi:hypothetical protein